MFPVPTCLNGYDFYEKPVKREKNILTNDWLSNIVTTVNVSTPQLRVLIKER